MAEALIRVMGAALLLLGAAGAGFSGIRNGRARIGELEAALALVRHIRESIGRLTAPLSEIYASFADPRLMGTLSPVVRRISLPEISMI